MRTPALSIVIPTTDEAHTVEGLLADLAALRATHEVIIADGGSVDDTVALATRMGARVVHAPRGRGSQLRAGVRTSSGRVLCVLHADVRLPAATLVALDALAREGAPRAVAFRLRIDARGVRYRLVEAGANLRSRVPGLPYGDQGLVVDRATYDAAGGFPDVPIMEDVLLVRALRGHGGVGLRREQVVVSARRWMRDGVWRRSARNLSVLLRWMLGASPHDLVARYERGGRRTTP